MNNKTILVVDDQKINLELMEKYLSGDAGYKVIVTQDNTNVEKLIRDNQPDAIIMDIVMPEMRGDEIARQLKSNPQTSGIPVILITADILQEKDNASADYFIRRPVIGEDLLKILSDIFTTPQ
ncbi:MAG: response regulator [Spirochaetales bacterium]|nr:response regulator [Spirochaetales bacterium]